MNLLLITLLLFAATFGLVLSAIYFLVQVPSQKKQMRTRLAAIQEVALDGASDIDAQIIRQQVLSKVPQLNKVLLQLPFLPELRLLLHQSGMEMDLGWCWPCRLAPGCSPFWSVSSST